MTPSAPQGRLLIIAGSDSGGGAGIQADIKAATMMGAYAATAITAVTVQNTLGVTAVHPIPLDILAALHPGAKDPDARLAGSLAAAFAGAAAGVAAVRVHDVAETAQALAVWAAIRKTSVIPDAEGDPGPG